MMEGRSLGVVDDRLIFSWPLDDDDDYKAKTILLDDNGDIIPYKDAIWKVLFSDKFRRSFEKLESRPLKISVMSLLLRLSTGWRPKINITCENSTANRLYLICTLDVIKDVHYQQVLKVWDILPFQDIANMTTRLKNLFSAYTHEFVRRCTAKPLKGNLEAPSSWPPSQEITRFYHLLNINQGDDDAVSAHATESTKVSESLLLMKFYFLSHEAVTHLLSGKKLNLPMQLTDEQMDIVSSRNTSFVIGRSGTGKTSVLTTKLLRNKQSPRQMFVTVSPTLCYAVKQHVSHLTSKLDDADAATQLCNIPDTLHNLPHDLYPLFITFRKFLLMLDGTFGDSFFNRLREGSDTSSKSLQLETLIKDREVTFKKFFSDYWCNFKRDLKKKVDCSRVFTEIISHIKGGLLVGESGGGKLSSETYFSLGEKRASNLGKDTRKIVYQLFEEYEKMKSDRGEFDIGDLVNDIHQRLENGNYESHLVDSVYIDEVQDLSMRQISLFKHICQNVDEGFMFSGDTAQTIAKGIDFRFQDLRSLFFKEFLRGGKSGKQEKGRVSELKQLKQNFRTHAGVLHLAQSVIDIMHHYFMHSFDKLEPEISLISGEKPVLFEFGHDTNAIVTILGGSRRDGEVVGFGAEQVILVRDDDTKNELVGSVEGQALVLTILECKGLEFQDVLLYNFFGTSPFKDQWRLIYDYMKINQWLDKIHPQSFPTFNEARHHVLCSELKQLYVAITRTRQRLWICENKEELSKPIFDYWKMRGLVQIQKLDESVAQAMRVASSPHEWLERGKELFYEDNFVMAALCFEQAGDRMWENLARASALRASADQIRGTNSEDFRHHVQEAAGLFVLAGKHESAASCYCDLGEYATAGKIYLQNCGKIDAAAECFTQVGCYSEAAEAYAKGDQFSKCLSMCKRGYLFDQGWDYICHWEKTVGAKSKEIEIIEQEFLESAALHYYKDKKDHKSMMKFVQLFFSMESKKTFLRSLGCLDDLLLLEESGHFLEAAELARSWGDVLKEASFLEKAGKYKEAALVLLWHVHISTLWENGNSGWPLKQFAPKEGLCNKVKLLAKEDSDDLYTSVCSELKILFDMNSSLRELMKDLHVSQNHRSLAGEILLIRKILDYHLRSSKHYCEDEFRVDINKHCEDKLFQNQVSVRTLAFYWNMWKYHIVHIFDSLQSFANEEPIKEDNYTDFLLYYFGVRKDFSQGNLVYLLVNEDAEWIKDVDGKGFHRDGKRLSINGKRLVSAIRSYWQSELLSLGMEVLKILATVGGSRIKKKDASGMCTPLLYSIEVSKFFLDCQHFSLPGDIREKLNGTVEYCMDQLPAYLFTSDWRESVSVEMVSLKETDLSVNTLDEIIHWLCDTESDLTYNQIGWVMMMCLCSRTSYTRFKKIPVRGFQWNPKWKSVVDQWNLGLKDNLIAIPLRHALLHTYSIDTLEANWGRRDFIKPHVFVHLFDRLMLWESFLSGILYTTKAAFVGWSTNLPSTHKNFPQLEEMYGKHELMVFVDIALNLLKHIELLKDWIKATGNKDPNCLPLLTLRLVMMISLICLQVPDGCSKLLLYCLTQDKNVVKLLPKKFVSALLKGREHDALSLNPEVVADAFKSIEDPLLIVCSGDESARIHAPSAIFVDLNKSKEEIMSVLLPRDKPSMVVPENMSSGKEDSAAAKVVLENKKGKGNKKGKKSKKKQR